LQKAGAQPDFEHESVANKGHARLDLIDSFHKNAQRHEPRLVGAIEKNDVRNQTLNFWKLVSSENLKKQNHFQV
jgi:hypothetical protein